MSGNEPRARSEGVGRDSHRESSSVTRAAKSDVASTEQVVTRNLIDGEWVEPGDYFEVRNPANIDAVVGYAPSSSRDDVERAIEAAARAFPSWCRLTATERARLLREAIPASLLDADERGRLLVREQGKVLKEAALEIHSFKGEVEGLAPFAERLDQPEVVEDERGRLEAVREPIGVTGIITPWNWPYSQVTTKMVPALLAGNTVVIKPSSYSPLAAALSTRLIAEKLPPGVINLVAGSASVVGEALTASPVVRILAFTGSTATGRKILRDSATSIKVLELELGGNDPAIILDDADLSERPAIRLMQAMFTTSGQGCMLIKRVYAHRRVYEEVWGRLTAGADKYYKVGNGLDPRTTMGPVNNSEQFKWVTQLVQDARDLGGTVLEVGTKLEPDSWDKGYFILPTFVRDVDDSASIVRDEQFGPAIPILPFDDIEEAVYRANNTPYGLAASVWGGDEARAIEVARRINAGAVFVNNHNTFAVMPDGSLGGHKDSGVGRQGGWHGLTMFTQLKVISTRLRPHVPAQVRSKN
jgi:aldehyde dehydrogenase